MRRIFFTFYFFLIFSAVFAQPFLMQSLDNQIFTVDARRTDDALALPVVELESEQQICISFDEMLHGASNFNYKIVHCNADWRPSSLAEAEFIDGFYDGVIDDYEQSINTLALYTHYQIVVPNDNLRFKVSGNYAVLIAENGDFENPVATACFSVVDSQIGVAGKIRSNTDIELNRRYQQLDFELNTQNYEVRDAFSELKVVVQQNRRADNKVLNLKPTFSTLGTQSYQNNRSLIFEGGNAYRTIDFSSEYTYGAGIERVKMGKEYLEVFLSPSEFRATRPVDQSDDANGCFLVNRQGSDYSEIEADYMWVHFTLPADEPYFGGRVYILGQMTGNRIDPVDRMEYDFEAKCYHKSLFLKQGGYNFQYLYVPKGSNTGSLQPIEGSFWQTQNEYTLFIYHRAWGERYDRLIAVKTIE